MIQAPDLPTWAALLTAFFVLFGAVIALIGSIGLLRLKTFYERMHAPTLGTTVGVAAILMASMICFSFLQSRIVLHEILIALFVSLDRKSVVLGKVLSLPLYLGFSRI